MADTQKGTGAGTAVKRDERALEGEVVPARLEELDEPRGRDGEDELDEDDDTVEMDEADEEDEDDESEEAGGDDTEER